MQTRPTNRKLPLSTLLALFIVLLCSVSNIYADSGQSAGDAVLEHTVSAHLIKEGHLPSTVSRKGKISLLSFGKPGLYGTLYEGLKDVSESIDISGYGLLYTEENVQLLQDTFESVVNDHPALFFVANTYGYSYTAGTSGVLSKFLPNYYMDGEELTNARTAFQNTIEEIAAPIDASWSDLEKALYLHDYLVIYHEYDTDGDEPIYRPDLFFIEKKGVCQAYSLAYKALLDEVGIANTYASSTAMNHIWNVVSIDGEWYHVDVTWDDPIPDMLGYCRHLFFLVSDDAIEDAERQHYDWISSVECTDTAYDDYFWKDVYSAFVRIGTQWYCILDDLFGFALHAWSGNQATSEYVMPFNDSDFYEFGFTPSLFDFAGKLYVNSSKAIFSIQPAEPSLVNVFSVEESPPYLFGMRRQDDKVEYLLATGYNTPDATLHLFPLIKEKSGIRIAAPPEKTTYSMGDIIDTNGLVVEIVYDDGSAEPTSSYTISADLSSLGVRQVTVAHEGFTATFDVAVVGLVVSEDSLGCKVDLFAEVSGTPSICLLAAYDSAGRMVSINSLAFDVSDHRAQAAATISVDPATSRYKAFLLDSTLAPISGPIQ